MYFLYSCYIFKLNRIINRAYKDPPPCPTRKLRYQKGIHKIQPQGGRRCNIIKKKKKMMRNDNQKKLTKKNRYRKKLTKKNKYKRKQRAWGVYF